MMRSSVGHFYIILFNNVVRLNLVYFTNYNFNARKGAKAQLKYCNFGDFARKFKKTSKINYSNYNALKINLLTIKLKF